MQLFKYALVFATCFALLDSADGNWLQNLLKGVGDGIKGVVKGVGGGIEGVVKGVGGGIKGVVKGVGDGIKGVVKGVGGGIKGVVKGVGDGIKGVVQTAGKVGCKALFGIACPSVVTVGGRVIKHLTGGAIDTEPGVKAINKACHVISTTCKRSVSNVEIIYPFSDVFSDYDVNDDKEITFTEFAVTVMTSVNLADPEGLVKPFVWSDVDGNGKLDMDEFMGAPLLFAHPSYTADNDNVTSAAA